MNSFHASSVRYLPALDGLRFVAALCVMLPHVALSIIKISPPPPLLSSFATLAGLGMTLFFVLSGFVIHYNYHALCSENGTSGVRAFAVARLSRLYPLYIVLVLYDLYFAYRQYPSNLIHAYEALAYYLPLVQAWSYESLGEHSLIYQFGYLSAVTWSISVEFFFYIAYAAVLHRLGRLSRLSVLAAIGIAAFIATLAALYVAELNIGPINSWAAASFGPIADIATGFQDSFVRWLTYFSPYARLMEFILGCIAAQAYIAIGLSSRRPRDEAGGGAVSCIVILAIAIVHFSVYLSSVTVLRAGSLIYAPLVAALVYVCAARANRVSRVLGSKLFRRGGDASYSIYLLHFVVITRYAQPHIPGISGLGILLAAKLFLTVAIVLVAARLTYVAFERPMKELCRGRLSFSGLPRTVAGGLASRPILILVLLLCDYMLRVLDRILLAAL